MCHIFCDSVERFQAGFGPHAKEIMAHRQLLRSHPAQMQSSSGISSSRRAASSRPKSFLPHALPPNREPSWSILTPTERLRL
jgi:hypothetical protein